MEISYLCHSSFLLKNKEAKLVCDPVGDAAGFKQAKVDADIVTISHDHHSDHNVMTRITGEPMIINGPGEYEIKRVSIVGLSTFHDEKQGKERGKNIIHVIDMDDVRICHLGDLGHKLTESQVSEVDGVDVLMVPVGGTFTINAQVAWDVVKQVNPSIILPMHFKTEEHNKNYAKLKGVDEFVKASQLEPRKMDKLVVKKMELPEELELVILSRYGK